MTTLTLKMDAPVGDNTLDRCEQGVLGQPLDRYEGPLKVSGEATYAYEHAAGTPAAYGVMVTSTIARGKLKGLDSSAAMALPGVIAVIDDPKLMPLDSPQSSDPKPDQGAADIVHFAQPIALVVAESFEAARAGALAVKADYEPPSDGRFDLAEQAGEARKPPADFFPPDNEKGDFDGIFAGGETTLDAIYTTPSQSHSAMEPHATLAVWNDGELTVYTSVQMVAANTAQLAKALGLSKSKVRVVARYIGGGFGSKLGISPDAVLASLAAMKLNRPVKVALTRQQVVQSTTRRTETIQRVRLAATKAGKLTAIGHDTLSGNRPGYDFWEPAGLGTLTLYAAPNRRITHRLTDLDLLIAGSMRAPGEAVGMLALENAMDEMAEKLGLDPIAFRKLNEPAQDPMKDVPFSSRQLIGCMDEGARKFGWSKRQAKPGGVREGEWLIGIGMAAATRSNYLQPSSATVRLLPGGTAAVETDMTDIGTGTYSVLSQVAGEMLGLQPGEVHVTLGDSRFPPGAGSGGSWGASSSGSSVYLACEALRVKLAKLMDSREEELTLKDGLAIAGNCRKTLTELIGDEPIEATGSIKPGANDSSHTQNSYGATFSEVAVSSVTGETKVRRMLGVFAAGRILNAKTARSQCIGGMAWGIGSALHEELAIDRRYGNLVNHDLAEYHVPANADVPQIEAIFLEERDPVSNPLKSKGIGELAISGSGAAVTNAIYNACGVRVRDYPMTLDKVIAGMDSR